MGRGEISSGVFLAVHWSDHGHRPAADVLTLNDHLLGNDNRIDYSVRADCYPYCYAQILFGCCLNRGFEYGLDLMLVTSDVSNVGSHQAVQVCVGPLLVTLIAAGSTFAAEGRTCLPAF